MGNQLDTLQQLLFSAAIGIMLGLVVGIGIGWGVAPVRYVDSPLSLMARTYHEEYTVMVATIYRYEGDLQKALDRLRPLGYPNIADWVFEVTERYISNSSSIANITDLVALTEAMGPLTPSMEIYRIVPTPAGAD